MDLLKYKEYFIKRLEKLLSEQEIREARKDHHAYRRPRPCGMTIHTGIGCSLRCVYCYIEDMGFTWNVRPYPLSGLQIAYALAVNPYFLPGKHGTLVAIGSVTEPFLGVTKNRTFEYIEAIKKYLGNPIQFSTKMYISIREAKILKEIDPEISPLITIITLKYQKKLEPYVPSAEKRFETITNLRSAGLKPILFLRPIIPGIIEEEYKDILARAKEAGAVGVVVGTLRITQNIVEKLRKTGIDVTEILRRAPRVPKGNEQVSINTYDIKKRIINHAKSLGLLAFPEACMANIYTHGRICWKMIYHGISEGGLRPRELNIDEIFGLARKNNLDVVDIRRNKYIVEIKLKGDKLRKHLFLEYIKCLYGICVKTKKL